MDLDLEPEPNDKVMTAMKLLRTLFVAAALVGTHWMGMTMAQAFAVPAEARAAQLPGADVAAQPAAAEKVVPVQAVVAG